MRILSDPLAHYRSKETRLPFLLSKKSFQRREYRTSLLEPRARFGLSSLTESMLLLRCDLSCCRSDDEGLSEARKDCLQAPNQVGVSREMTSWWH